MRKRLIIGNKKGVADIKLWIPIVVIMVMVSIFMVAIYKNVAVSRALAGSQTTSKELGFEIEAAYSAPESVNIMHEVPLREGYPALGTVLINHEEQKVCTSEYTEDEMWENIFNHGLTSYVGGRVTQAMWYNRKGITTALRGMKTGFTKVAGAVRGVKRLPLNLIKATGKKLVGKKLGKGAIWDTAKKPGRISRVVKWPFKMVKKGAQWVGRKIAFQIGKLLIKAQVWATKTLASKTSGWFGKFIAKHIASFFARVEAKTVEATAQAAVENVPCGPIPLPCGQIVSYGISAVSAVIDSIMVYYPLFKTIRGGHEASDNMLESVSCYKYIREDDKLYVGPPNCASEAVHSPIDLAETKGLGWIIKKTGAKSAKVPIFPVSKKVPGKSMDAPGRVVYDAAETCKDAPNAFIAYEDPAAEFKKIFAGVFTAGLTAGGRLAFGDLKSDRTTTGEAMVYILAPKAICQVLTFAKPSVGTVCGIAHFVALGVTFYTIPEQYLSILWGSNILPASEWHYMNFPLYISVEKEYDAETGESKLSVEKVL